MTTAVPISGSEPSKLFTINPTEFLDPDYIIDLIIQIRPDPENEPVSLLEDARAGKRMSRSEFLKKVGSSQKEIDEVVRFAESYGLTVLETNPMVGAVWLTGPVEKIRDAFDVKIRWYNFEDNQYYGNDDLIKVPAHLSPIILTVAGMNNFPVFARPYPRNVETTELQSIPSPLYYPHDLAEIYRFPARYLGDGQCHGIWSLGGGFYRTEIENYYRSLLIPDEAFPDLTWVGDNNPSPMPELTEAVLKLWGQGITTGATDQTAWTLETTLDVELATTLAPRAKTVVFFPPKKTRKGMTPSPELTVLETLYEIALDQIQMPTVVSASWAYFESFSRISYMKALSDWLGLLTSLGVTFCFSSGNWGSRVSGFLTVGFPASSPYVLGCGGTRLISVNKKDIDSETVWNQVYGKTFFASTGGASKVFALPKYQADAGVEAKTGIDGRGTPDVAATSDFETGVYLLIGGVTVGSAGTSASAQMWGALMTRINQGLGFPVGFINPLLYEVLPPTFNDITQGDNFPRNRGPQYSASPGWDPCCGLGTPNGQAILDALIEIFEVLPE